MTSASAESTADLSPSGPHSIATFFGHRGATWREALDGSAALVLGGLGAAAIATVLVRFVRQRRGAS